MVGRKQPQNLGIEWRARLLGTVFALIVGFCTMPLAAQETADPSEIRVAYADDYLPLSGVNFTGAPSGFLIDVWQAWSEKTGVPVNFVKYSFDESLEAVRDGRADAHLGLFRNDTRAEWLSFSRTLIETSTYFYYWRTNRDLVPTIAGLSSRAVGVIKGTDQEQYARASKLRLRPRTFNDALTMLRALARGEVSAVLHEDIPMQSLTLQHGIGGNISKIGTPLFREGVHAAVRTDNRAMRALVDWGFSQIGRDELAEIERRWIDDQDLRYYRGVGHRTPFNKSEKAWLRAHPKIRIGIQTDWPPMSFQSDDGDIKGMTRAFIDKINGRLGGIIELVPGPWRQMLDDVRAKRLDGVVDITALRYRMPDFNFTQPYLNIPHVIVCGDDDTITGDFKTLGGRTIALEKGYATVKFIEANYPQIAIKEYDNTLDALESVARGEADAWAGNRAIFSYLSDVHADTLNGLKIGGTILDRQSILSIGVREDWGILRDIFDKALAGIPATEAANITEPWLKGTVKGSIALSVPERRWLTEHETTRVRVLVSGWEPFNYMKDGQPSGLAIKYIKYALRELGLDADFVEMPWPDAMESISNLRDIDVIADITASPERSQLMAFTRPHLIFPMVIFNQSDAPLVSDVSGLSGKTVAVERGYIMEGRLRRDHPEINLMLVNSTHEAIKAVSLGNADAYIGNLAAGSYHIERHGFSNVKVAAPTEYADDRQGVGVRRDWPELAGMIGKVIDQMPDEQHAALRSDALAVRFEQGINVAKIMMYVLPTAGIILVIFGIFVYANRKMSRQIEERKKVEQSLNEKDVQLTAALENMSGGMFMIDRHLRLRVFNQKFKTMYQLPPIEAGTPLRDVLMIRAVRGDYGPGDPDDYVDERLAGYLTREAMRTEDTVPGGRVIEGYRQPTNDGGMVCVFNDITDRKKAEQTLAEQTTKLQDLSGKLSRYLSPQIYEAIFAGESDAELRTERKKLTVFFSDIRNFTATTEGMEPEDMTFLLNDYLTKMTEIALEYGGTIDKYIGDAIMVFFGDPETKGVKQDALAAVNMAIAMQRRMVDLRAKWADMGFSYPFHIRCGVNTGYCNVGNFGSEQRIDYTIIGGQVNLAARLEGICEPDGVTIAYETYSHVRDEISAEPLEPIEVKGIKEPVQPFAVTGIFDGWDDTERYIRRDDIRGLRLWVDLMRMSEERRLQSIRELEEAIDILKKKKADAETA